MKPGPTIPLIVITGPTASGKTSLAVKLAEKWGGEIICADSRTVYKGMDIGTAKPTKAEQKKVKHWGLDLVEPNVRFTAHDFQTYAQRAIADIRKRGKIPFLVGGTGLYIDAVILNFTFGSKPSLALRQKLQQKTTEELKELIIKQQLPLPENQQNRRHLIRCIENNNTPTARNNQLDPTTYCLAIKVERDVLHHQIVSRVNEMFRQNIVQETQQLFGKWGSDCGAFTGNIYPIVTQLIAGIITETQAKALLVTRDYQLAKRQVTWLKRHNFVVWRSLVEAEPYIDTLLGKWRVTPEHFSGTIENDKKG